MPTVASPHTQSSTRGCAPTWRPSRSRPTSARRFRFGDAWTRPEAGRSNRRLTPSPPRMGVALQTASFPSNRTSAPICNECLQQLLQTQLCEICRIRRAVEATRQGVVDENRLAGAGRCRWRVPASPRARASECHRGVGWDSVPAGVSVLPWRAVRRRPGRPRAPFPLPWATGRRSERCMGRRSVRPPTRNEESVRKRTTPASTGRVVGWGGKGRRPAR